MPHQRKRDLLLALVATAYGCWLVTAGGWSTCCWWRCSTARHLHLLEGAPAPACAASAEAERG